VKAFPRAIAAFSYGNCIRAPSTLPGIDKGVSFYRKSFAGKSD
jgi:hypothetical protein